MGSFYSVDQFAGNLVHKDKRKRVTLKNYIRNTAVEQSVIDHCVSV